jgi:protein-tyrosine-phosphatase
VPVNHLARQVLAQDFEEFDFVLAMDTSNLQDLQDFVDGLDQREQAKLGKGGHQKTVEC